MRVYLAAQFKRRDELVQYAAELTKKGWQVTSRWLFEDTTTPTNISFKECTRDYLFRCAQRDIEDINNSDAFIFFSESEMTPRGSRHVEFGYAMASRKLVFVIGPKENLFHELVECFSDWNEFMKSEWITDYGPGGDPI